MNRYELADLTARLYLVKSGIPYGVAMMLSNKQRDEHFAIMSVLNGDEPDDDDPPPPPLVLIDLEAERGARSDPPTE